MKLLAIGGPKHGEYLPYEEGRLTLIVPVIPDLKDITAAFGRDRYCIHAASVDSRTDGDRHHVPAARIAELYRLRPREWQVAPTYGHPRKLDSYCLFPDYWGRYDRATLPPLVDMLQTTTIRTAEYNRRLIADRAVWVWVG